MDKMVNNVFQGNSADLIKELDSSSIHVIISDIPYGISYDEWDVLHNNTNSALLGTSEAQLKAGGVFRHRGKPLNGWSEKDKEIPLEYQRWCEGWASEWLRVLMPASSVFIFAGRRMAHRCIVAMENAGFLFKDMISWQKDHAPHRAQRISIVFNNRKDILNATKWEGWRVGNLRPIFEPILWFMKPYTVGGTLTDNIRDYDVGAFNNELWKSYTTDCSNVLKIPSKKSDHGLHPTQKPVEIMEALIRLVTIENQIVLDPFCGSGSTLVAAKNLGRKYIGFEISQEFVDVAKKRLLVA